MTTIHSPHTAANRIENTDTASQRLRHPTNTKAERLGPLDRIMTIDSRKAVRSQLKHALVQKMASLHRPLATTDLKALTTDLTDTYRDNPKMVRYIEYKINDQKDRLNALATSTNPTDNSSAPTILPAKKAGLTHDIFAARSLKDSNHIALYEKPTRLSHEDIEALAERGIERSEGNTSPFLGKGGFGTVDLVRALDDQQWYAHKVTHSDKKHMTEEIEVSQLIAGPTIDGNTDARDLNLAPITYIRPYPNPFATTKKPLAAHFISELGDTKSLRQHFNSLPKGDQIKFLKDMLIALKSLHDKGIYHRDIKPENILLKNGKPAFIDFGLSSMDRLSKGTRGTLNYVAPELYFDETPSDAGKADLYSLGITIAELDDSICLPYIWDAQNVDEYLSSLFKRRATAVRDFNRAHRYDNNPHNAIQILAHKLIEPFPVSRPTTGSAIACLDRALTQLQRPSRKTSNNTVNHRLR